MRTALALALVTLATLPAPGPGQVMPEVGERVRIRHVDGRLFVGPLESTSAEEIRVGGPGGPYDMRREEIAAIERSLGERRHFASYFFATLGIAAGSGGAIGALTWGPCSGDCWFHPRDRTDAFGWGAVVGGVLGFPLALLVGIASKTERWELLPTAAVGSVTMSLAPAGHGTALYASIPIGRRPPLRPSP